MDSMMHVANDPDRCRLDPSLSLLWVTTYVKLEWCRYCLRPTAVLPSMTPEQTGVVGTSFYISPEINEGWPQHDEKVKTKHAPATAFADPVIHTLQLGQLEARFWKD